MNAIIAILVMAVLPQSGPINYVPIVQNKKWGYIDTKGKVVIQPQFDNARAFTGPLAPAMKGGKWGLVNHNGAWTLAPEYEFVGDFSMGLACVVQNGRIGFVNASGQVVIRPTLPWPVADPPIIPKFTEGLAGVIVEANGQHFAWGYIDMVGNRMFDATFLFGGEFSEGLAAVAIEAEAWGYIDRTGKLVIEPTFQYAGMFRDGLAPVVKDSKFGYIDKSGTLLIPNKYSDALEFSEGLALVLDGEKYKVIDTEGKQAFSKTFAELDPLALDLFRFSEGMLVFIEENAEGEWLWGYVDRSGKVAIPARFQFAGLFKNGIAPVTIRRGDDYFEGYIDKAGNYVWQPSK